MSTTTPAPLARALAPNRSELLDLVMIFALGATALWGFRSTFTGTQFFVVGLIALALGLAIGHLANALDQPVILLALLTVVAFFLLGGAVALRSQGTRAALPLPSTIETLLRQATEGWKDLLTTLPPVDGSGPLLVLPYVLGLVAGAGGAAVAQRRPWTVMPVLPPLMLLASVILLGAQQAGSLVRQGLIFTVVALVWVALRSARHHTPVRSGNRPVTRLALGVALLAGACAVAVPVATHGPGADRPRVVLRTYVEPPFDVGKFASPLASFRRYTKRAKADSDQGRYEKVVLKVAGAPDGTLVRFGAMDDYDGIVWGASSVAPAAGALNATFQRVGGSIPTTMSGKRVKAKITLTDYSGVWLPTIGGVTGVQFGGSGAKQETNSFRYNIATSTGVVPTGLSVGDSYTIEAVVPDQRLPKGAESSGEVLAATARTDFLRAQATDWSGNAATPLQRVLALAAYLRTNGYYSDGAEGAERQYHAGHFVGRLQTFAGDQIVGDDEQYAAAFALMANSLGAPTRVVMGGAVEGGQIKGKDVHAWVETKLDDGTWRTIPTDAFMRHREPRTTPPQDPETTTGLDIPPPAPVQPPSVLSDPTSSDLNALRGNKDGQSHFPAWLGILLTWAGPPVLVVALLLALILGAKALRRRRRRTRGSGPDRVAGAWAELMDRARDKGVDVPVRATRREQGRLTDEVHDLPLARRADAMIFGPGEVSDEAASRYWGAVDELRKQRVDGETWRQHVRHALSLRSLRANLRTAPRPDLRALARRVPRPSLGRLTPRTSR